MQQVEFCATGFLLNFRRKIAAVFKTSGLRSGGHFSAKPTSRPMAGNDSGFRLADDSPTTSSFVSYNPVSQAPSGLGGGLLPVCPYFRSWEIQAERDWKLGAARMSYKDPKHSGRKARGAADESQLIAKQ